MTKNPPVPTKPMRHLWRHNGQDVVCTRRGCGVAKWRRTRKRVKQSRFGRLVPAKKSEKGSRMIDWLARTTKPCRPKKVTSRRELRALGRL